MKITPTQKRALQAQTLLNSGMDPKAAARECGYKNVNGMMGAIALCLRKIPQEESDAIIEQMHQEDASQKPKAETAEETPDNRGEYTIPGIYNLEGEGEVLVGEQITREEWNQRRQRHAEDVRRRLEERGDIVRSETKRVICRHGLDEKTGVVQFRLHVCGIDKWIVIDEDLIGGREEMIHLLSDTIAAINLILEGIA
ncbi:MAG: hypothetical protein IJD94_05180 [Clostridia bacterium]|nr:hypothetical protein [Clostridia bacterium]